jgi:endogenous inhibitor of DNA gyrase (YacG/DUF329 family)
MTCPICKSGTVWKFRPFCSRRCADLDLGRWVDGTYAIPSEEVPDEEIETDAGDGDPARRRH